MDDQTYRVFCYPRGRRTQHVRLLSRDAALAELTEVRKTDPLAIVEDWNGERIEPERYLDLSHVTG